MGLQPHEGASGTPARAAVGTPTRRFNPTRVHLELLLSPLRVGVGRFNPTRVHLERRQSRGQVAHRHQLQPHEGASGTVVVHLLFAVLEIASTPRGCIWNNRTARAHAGPVDASTPRGCIWNVDRRPSSSASQRGFNPTRVHLELEAMDHFETMVVVASTPRGCIWNTTCFRLIKVFPLASTPRGCIWNGRFLRIRGRQECASTPRGCIWNRAHRPDRHRTRPASTPRGCIWNRSSSNPLSSSITCFNPTRVHLELSRFALVSRTRDRLQPHEGASGTLDRPMRTAMKTLQPHEGASGTRLVEEVRDERGASTPRGCIWNSSMGVRPMRDAHASTPRGCIWNQSRLRRCHARQECFNPTRVHLEPRLAVDCRDELLSFNPTRVHLERDRSSPVPSRVSGFNPTRVHLERISSSSKRFSGSLQPHEGASGTG